MNDMEILNNCLLITKIAYVWSKDNKPGLGFLFDQLLSQVENHSKTFESILVYYPNAFLAIYQLALMIHYRETIDYEKFIIE